MEESVLSGRGRAIAAIGGLAAAILAWLATGGLELSLPARNLLAVTVLMAAYWAAQPIPMAVTSLMPIALYPLLGIAAAKNVCATYGDRNVFLYFGGFVVALGLERWQLHRRIALHTVRMIGSSPRRLVFGFAIATAFISMWISNTATTLLMLPIAMSLLQMFDDELPNLDGGLAREDLRIAMRPFEIALLLAVAFGATCGGMATIIGTPTNTSFRGFWQRNFVEQGHPPVSAGEWMIAFVPLAMLMLIGVCGMTTCRLPKVPGVEQLGAAFCRERLREMGRLYSGEWLMLVVFVATAGLWITREDLSIAGFTLLNGWGPVIEDFLAKRIRVEPQVARGMVDDSTVAVLMATLMFFLQGRRAAGSEREPLIDWPTVEKRIPWGVLLLFGGGFAMADAFQSTGLAVWLGERISGVFAQSPTWLVIGGSCLMVTVLSEFTSNVATVNTVLPILAPIAVGIGVDPRLLLLPVAISASFGFMLPVATPPNAIVYGTGRVPVRAMMRYGLLLDVLGIVLITVWGVTVIPWVFTR